MANGSALGLWRGVLIGMYLGIFRNFSDSDSIDK